MLFQTEFQFQGRLWKTDAEEKGERMGGPFLKKGSPQNPLPKTSNVEGVGDGMNGQLRPKMLRDFGIGASRS